METQILAILQEPKTWLEVARLFAETPPVDVSRALARLKAKKLIQSVNQQWGLSNGSR